MEMLSKVLPAARSMDWDTLAQTVNHSLSYLFIDAHSHMHNLLHSAQQLASSPGVGTTLARAYEKILPGGLMVLFGVNTFESWPLQMAAAGLGLTLLFTRVDATCADEKACTVTFYVLRPAGDC